MIFVFFMSIANATTTIDWYDSGVGDKTKTVLEVNCNNKQYQLVMKKNEIGKRERNIIEWFDKIKAKCNEGEKK